MEGPEPYCADCHRQIPACECPKPLSKIEYKLLAIRLCGRLPDREETDCLLATIDAQTAEIEGRDKRRTDLLAWLQERIGTAWECENCGYSTYHSSGFECDNCAFEMPIEHIMAFKLHAPLTHPSGEEPTDRVALRTSGAKPTT